MINSNSFVGTGFTLAGVAWADRVTKNLAKLALFNFALTSGTQGTHPLPRGDPTLAHRSSPKGQSPTGAAGEGWGIKTSGQIHLTS